MKKRLFTAVACVFVVAAAVGMYLRVEGAADEYSEAVLRTTVTGRVNGCIYDYAVRNAETFAAVCDYRYGVDGKLCLITVNSATVNVIRVEIEALINNEVEKLYSERFEMPIGNVSGLRMLSGCGPRIKIKIVPLGYAECDTVNEFTSVGVNQTLHKVGLRFTIRFCGAPPFNGTTYESEFYIAICENLIAGEVPLVYLK